MKKLSVTIVAMGLAIVGTGHAQEPDRIALGLRAALYACEQWILEPKTWVESIDGFASAIGLENVLQPVRSIPEETLPAANMRANNHYWRINISESAGYVIVLSDTLAICHITGGGDVDMQPAVEAIIAADTFKSRWHKKVPFAPIGEMVSDQFENIEEPKFRIVISRANQAGARQDRVQVLATAFYNFKE